MLKSGGGFAGSFSGARANLAEMDYCVVRVGEPFPARNVAYELGLERRKGDEMTGESDEKQSGTTPNGDVVFKKAEWPDTLRGLGDLREQSGAAAFVPWKRNPSVAEAKIDTKQ